MPDKCAALNAVTQTHKTKKKMKPLHMVLTVASIAMFISALTSFGVLHMDGAGDGELLEASLVDIPAADSLPEMETPIATRYLTAFAVAAPGYYLTSSDVGGPGSSCLMRGGDDYNIRGKVVHRDTVLGLAVVFDPMDQMNGLPYMPAAEASPMGETVFTVGFPDGGFQYSQGVISSTDEQFSKADISGSAPGAPVFAPQGQWIGIIVNSQENKGKSKILHVGEIRDFLEKAIDGGDYPKAILPRRNRLYYDNRPAQVDKIRPQVRMIEIKG